jgi:hypothetical protein
MEDYREDYADIDIPDELMSPWTRTVWLGHTPRSSRATPFLYSDLHSIRWDLGRVDGRPVRTLADIAAFNNEESS